MRELVLPSDQGREPRHPLEPMRLGVAAGPEDEIAVFLVVDALEDGRRFQLPHVEGVSDEATRGFRGQDRAWFRHLLQACGEMD